MTAPAAVATVCQGMCGIVGFIAARDVRPPDPSGLHDAVLALRHRGPNESGTFVAGPALLGNTRLSIIDLAGGSQPISNEDGSIVVVYNGEIWNYRALRDELAGLGHVFVTKSDTEVLVHGYEEWGEGLVEHLDGMFAFAVWDAGRERLFLGRDRFGKKPLYVRAYRSGSRLRVGCAVGIPRLGRAARDRERARRRVPLPAVRRVATDPVCRRRSPRARTCRDV